MQRSLPCRATCALLAGLLALLPALRASAARRGGRHSVVVAPYVPLQGVSAAMADRATELVQGELAGREGLKLVAPPAPHGKRAPVDVTLQLMAAREQAAVARELSEKSKHLKAASVLAKAVGALAARPVAIDQEGGKVLADLCQELAAERISAGDEDGGDAALAMLVRLAPERGTPTGDFPPSFLRSFQTVQRRMLAQQRGRLRVRAPRGSGDARVLLDGRLLANAPALIKDVLPGDHFVRVERRGEAWAERVTVLEGAEQTLSPQLGGEPTGPAAELQAALETGTLDRAAVAKAARLARAATAQAAVFGVVTREGQGFGVRSFAYLTKADKVVPLARMALDSELLGAQLEVLKVADDLAAKLARGGHAIALPASLGAPQPAVDSGTYAEVSAAPGIAVAAEAAPAPLPRATPLPDLPGLVAPAPAERAVARPVASASVPAAAAPAPAPAPAAAAAPAPSAAPAAAPAPAAVAAPSPARSGAAPAAATPAPAAARLVVKPGDKAPPAPAAPAPAAPAPLAAAPAAAAPVGDAPPLVTANVPVRRADEPSKSLVVPRSPTGRTEADAIVQPDKPRPVVTSPVTKRLEAVEPSALVVPREQPQPSARKSTVLWVIVGVVAAGALGAGGYLLYQSSRTPSTATINASWAH